MVAVGASALGKAEDRRAAKPRRADQQQQGYLGLGIFTDDAFKFGNAGGGGNGTEVMAVAFCSETRELNRVPHSWPFVSASGRAPVADRLQVARVAEPKLDRAGAALNEDLKSHLRSLSHNRSLEKRFCRGETDALLGTQRQKEWKIFERLDNLNPMK